MTFETFKQQYKEYVETRDADRFPEIVAFFDETIEEPEYSHCIENEDGDTMYTASFEEAYKRFLRMQLL